ncbi:MAG: alkaline phosphatase [Longimicrobiales bacterium]
MVRYRTLLVAAAMLAVSVAGSAACARAPQPVRPDSARAPQPETTASSPTAKPGGVTPAGGPRRGSAIFVHPDGAGPAHWNAARLLTVGPDGTMAWDRLEQVGVYRGHMTNSLGASSHGGATAHAYGVKVPYDSYGMAGQEPLTALSGKPFSILTEAKEAGLATALINSGHIAEPGTGVFAASAASRSDIESITTQILEGGTDIILAGGEILLLPVGEKGYHGYSGMRRGDENMVERARELGYRVVYTRDQLMALPDTTSKVLGLFAASHTFWDRSEELLEELGLPLYVPEAPSLAEMTRKALRMLATRDTRFLLVVEEEGSDNFANHNNARGTLTALARADDALDVALGYIERNPETLLLTTADSDAGGLQVFPVRDPVRYHLPLQPTTNIGSPLDGRAGTGTPPFIAVPDAAGRELRFGIAWAGQTDFLGGNVARARGLNAELLPANVDNTDIYRMLYATLFGRWLE